MATAAEAPETAKPTNIVSVPVRGLRDALTAANLVVATGNDATAVPVLGMVHVAAKGHELVVRGTDRYHLLEATVQLAADAGPWEVLLSGADVKQILTALPKAPGALANIGPDDDETFAVAVNDGASMRLRLQDGDYPKTDSVFPGQPVAMDHIRLDSKRLATLAKMPGRGRRSWVQFALSGEGKPVVAKWDDDDTRVTYRYLLMPVKDN